jgi:hypothetical protein
MPELVAPFVAAVPMLGIVVALVLLARPRGR